MKHTLALRNFSAPTRGLEAFLRRPDHSPFIASFRTIFVNRGKKTITLPWPVTRSPWARDQVVGYEDTAFCLEADTFDLCGGHSTAKGIYHYHSTAGCLQEQAVIQAGTSASGHSALLGWAYVSRRFV